ncbi:hypothetical protein SAMN02910384_02925 [Pseudobutyrivibrio sp. ACV-2]|uniref:fibronectin type III domain-containing protein n=1 Tax=Pseudobutyrivibrio sp. ACV-2 TaxID=1520801 RepID=UPI000899CD53|nr:fibronectin type III domain-containing protein [Pseudobutyrivibrio sp. ACV-2]SEA97785.1 hypothetical protein SAMN02910384_02925 [Pseudobutyrivibrio sp. ACV-2]
MRENLDVIKRLLAIGLSVFLAGSTLFGDFIVIADQENHCEEFTDDYAYTDNGTLVPGENSDGYCDDCGRGEEFHDHIAEPEGEAAEVAAENATDVTEDVATDIGTGEGLEPTTDEQIPENPEQPGENPENITAETGDAVENPAETQTPQETTPEETAETTDETITTPETETPVENIEGTETEEETQKADTPQEEVTELDEIDEADKEAEEKRLAEEKEKEKKEGCIHNWEYTSNGDGTHVKRCTECGEEVAEECAFDGNGKCFFCGYEKAPEECEHEWEYTANNDGTHLRKCVKCGIEELENCEYGEDGLCKYCGAPNMTLEQQTYSRQFGTTTVTVSGNMPAHSKVTIYKAGTKVSEHIVNEKLDDKTFIAYEAYNINIYDASGRKYQPEEHGDSVTVSFSGVDDLEKASEEEVTVYRIEDDYEITEIETEVEGEDVTIEAEHFTIYTIGTTTCDSYQNIGGSCNFAYIKQATIANYTRVRGFKFYLYYPEAKETTFKITYYKNLKHNEGKQPTNPTDGVEVASKTITVNGSAGKRYAIDEEFDNISSNPNAWVTKDNYYSIVVEMDSSVHVGYDEGSIETYFSLDKAPWSNTYNGISYNGIFQETETNVETKDNIGDNYIVSKLVADGTLGSDKQYHYASGDKATVTASLGLNPGEDAKVERTIVWSSSDSNIVKVTPKTAMTAEITADAPGTAVITASYNNKTLSISVSVLTFFIEGTETIGDKATYSTPYTGQVINNLTYKTLSAAGTTVSDIDSSYPYVKYNTSNNTNVGKATVTISYYVGDNSVYTYDRYFNITPLNLTESVFANATFTVSGGTIQSFSTVGAVNGVIPVYNTDFDAEIVGEPTASSEGLKYDVRITGKGNFINENGAEIRIERTVAGIDIATLLNVELSSNSRLKTIYFNNGNITLTANDTGWDEVVFKDLNGQEKNGIVTPNTADYVIKDSAGNIYTDSSQDPKLNKAVPRGNMTIIFKMKSEKGYIGELSVPFVVQEASISAATVEWIKGNEYKHTGKDITLTPGEDFTVKLNNEVINPEDYTVDYPGNHKDIGVCTLVIKGTGTNFDEQSSIITSFKIISNFDIDLEIRISDGGTVKKGTSANEYKTGYTEQYTKRDNPEDTYKSMISVYLTGTGPLSQDTDYTLNIYDDEECINKIDSTSSIGTKYIRVEGIGAYATEPKQVKTATFTVVPRQLTSSGIRVLHDGKEISAAGTITKEFTGRPLTLTTGTSDSSVADIVVKYGDAFLNPGNDSTSANADYYITYKDNENTNVGTVEYEIHGIGKYAGVLKGRAYQYTITPASLSEGGTARASLGEERGYTYTGSKWYPPVKVSIGSTFNETYTYSGTTFDSENFTVKYEDNLSPGTAKITVTGKNNLTGSQVINFTIASNTDEFKGIYIGGTNPARYVKTETGSDANKVVTRIYTCDTLNAQYTGKNYNGSITVYGIDPTKPLTRGEDFYAEYHNPMSAKKYTVGDTASPYLEIRGQGKYLNNIALVYFNIQPRSLNDSDITVVYTNHYEYNKDTPVNPVFTVKYKAAELVPDLDYTVELYNTKPTFNETTKVWEGGEPVTNVAGKKYALIKGKGNYTDSRIEEYTVGKDISETYVQILGAQRNDDVFLAKSSESKLEKISSLKTKTSPLNVVWRGDTAAPRIDLYFSELALTPKSTDASDSPYDYELTMTNMNDDFKIDGKTGYRSRLTEDVNDTNYNIIEVKINGGNTGYFGSATFYIRVMPQDIDIFYNTSMAPVQYIGTRAAADDIISPYTGAEQTIIPKVLFTIQSASGEIRDYQLNSGDVKDFITPNTTKPTEYIIGPDLSDNNIVTTLTGVGNFRGTTTHTKKITRGNVNIYRAAKKDDGTVDKDTEKFVGVTSGEEPKEGKSYVEYAVEFNLHDDSMPQFTYNGKSQIPVITLTSRNGSNDPGPYTLKAGSDYEMKVYDDEKSKLANASDSDKQDATCVGTKTIEIRVTNSNFYSGIIKLHYAIVTNSITSYVGSISDITYKAVDLTPAQIADYIDKKTNTISLKKTANSENELTYGKDYAIVAPATDDDKREELDAIHQQPEYASVADIRGVNNKPIYGTEGTEKNWIFVKGIGTYSGYKQIFFNTVLDLGSAYAQVSVNKGYYELNAQGETTEKIVPTIKYQEVKQNATDPTSYATLSNTSTVEALAKDNYTISRDRNKLPGPDPSLAVNGQYACTGKATNVRYVDGNTASEVYFLADLSDYGPDTNKITFANGTVYRYTGDAVKPRPVGDVLDGASLAETDQATGDYTIIYTRDPSNLERDTAKDVGKWYAVIKATADASNQYYVSNSSTAIPFYIKYNLADAEITVVDPAQGFKSVDSVEYTGNPFKLYTKKPYDQDESKRGNVRITIKGKEVYNEGSPGLPTNDYFTISPDSVTTVGEHTITVDKTTLGGNFVYGDPNTSKKFRVKQVGLKTKAKFKLYDPDNPSTERYEYGYIGSAIKPVVKGTIDGKELVEGTDFRVTYKDNVNAGVKTASVSIKGMGAYSDSDTFTPEDCKFTITKLALNDPHVVVEVEDATYSGFYNNPDVPAEEDRVELKPKYSVYYVDSAKKIKNLLKENTNGSTAGDWKFYSWANNTVACDKNDSSIADEKKPRVKVESYGTNTIAGTYAVGYFTIHKLELARDNISIDQTTHEFTGDWIDISDIVKLSTTYTNSSGKKVSVPLVRDGYSGDIGSDISDYTVTITGGSNIQGGKVKDRGNYRILISGINSCESSFEVDFTVTPRSLEDHYHYYYEKGNTTGWIGKWSYDKVNKRYICIGGKGKDSFEDLTIYVYDVETVNTAGVTPEVVIEDTGRADSNLYTLDAAEFTVTAYNNKAAASAEWSKSTTTDANKGYHAKVADGSPYITITGTGNYGGTITLPFNIGKNINTAELDIKYTVTGVTNPFTYKPEYDNPKKPQAEMQYTYNATRQRPTVSVHTKDGNLLRPDKDYKVTYTDAAGDEDSSINAGWKNVVITGIGDYCGKISQMYVINRKAITAKGGPYRKDSPMIASNDEQTQTLEFTLDGNTVTRFTDATLKTYLVDTGIMSAAQAAEFKDFYFAVYNRKDIKPKVNVIDYNLGSNGTTHLKISEDDLDFAYENENVASVFTKAENGTVDLTTFSKVTVSFKRNYFVSQPTSTEVTGSPGYVFHYIIVQHNIEERDMLVHFKDEDGANQTYDAGKNIEPDVKVTDGGQPLVEGTDYKKSYSKNHNVPGKHTVTVEGIGNFRGTKTLDYTIWATMADVKVGYYDENHIFHEGIIPTQQYTGEHITEGLPEISLILPKNNNDQLEDFKLEYGEHYTATDWGSDDGYLSVGKVVYSGLNTGYFMAEPKKEINYDIWFDEENIKAINYEPTYQFTGYDIIPDFKLNVSTGSIDKDSIKIYKNDDRTKEADNFSDVGKYTASMHYTIGSKEGDIEANYEIVLRNIANCTIIPAEGSTLRYRGIVQKPGVKVFIESTPNKRYTLDMFDGTSGDYQVEYGEAVYGPTNIRFTGVSDRLKGEITVPYNIKLQSVANLRVTDDTGDSLTVAWVGELYSDGTDLKLWMKKADGTYEEKQLKRMVGRQNNTFTFEGLKNSTEYKIEAIAYATLKDGTEITSATEEIYKTTDIATTALKVTSRNAGRATISGWPNDGTVNHYYIYRSESPNDKGKVIAIIPATTRSYTNTKLDSGKTYYYTVEGYIFEGDGDKSVQVNTSKTIPVVVK